LQPFIVLIMPRLAMLYDGRRVGPERYLMTAQRLIITAPRQCQIETFEPPTQAGWGEAVMRIHYSLVSPGTDMSNFRCGPSRPGPFCPGYTAVGVLESVGAGLDAKLGTPYFLFPSLGDSFNCHGSHKLIALDGILVPLPAGLSEAKAGYARLINVGMTPFCHYYPQIEDTCLVIGLGLVGNLVAQVARLKGLRVIGMEPNASRRERARTVGFTDLVDPTAGDPVAAVKALTEGRGAGLTVNASGVADTFMTAIACTATGGELSTLGGVRGETKHTLQPFLTQVQQRHVTIRGGWEMLLPRRFTPGNGRPCTERNLEQALRWLVTNQIQVDPLWTHTLQPAELPAAYHAFDQAHPDYFGVVTDWRG
jgi:threonine dehydrogenase-like Zn-dependent dehydrogenase